jgi:hypothetical protein
MSQKVCEEARVDRAREVKDKEHDTRKMVEEAL